MTNGLRRPCDARKELPVSYDTCKTNTVSTKEKGFTLSIVCRTVRSKGFLYPEHALSVSRRFMV